MKILYYDCFCGISGDMNLGALIDLGVEPDYLKTELAKLDLPEEYQLEINKKTKNGISGTRVNVVLGTERPGTVKCADDAADSKIKHEHDHHDAHSHKHCHRNLKDIEDIIRSSKLDEKIKNRSMEMFYLVAKAEAKVHQKDIHEIHFHEVGATDSIIDFVGAAIALEKLQVDKIMASTVQLGGGFVKCAHGIIPIPAPATVEILKGIPVAVGIVAAETTTPTGAAILAANVDAFCDKIHFSIEKTGYGIGYRDFDITNVLRVFLGEMQE